MRTMPWNFVLYGLVMVAFSLYVLGIGVWGLIKKRPLILPAHQFMWFLLALYAAQVINSVVPLFTIRWLTFDPFFFLLPVFQILMFFVLIYVLQRQMTGYLILGVTDETFRDALTAVLNELNLPFQETISKIKLTSLEADLQVAVASWVGSAQISIPQQPHAHLTAKIAHSMDNYYQKKPIKVNSFIFITYLILGILLTGFIMVFGASFLIR